MRLTSSGDEFCARTDKALAGIPGVFKLVDDILMFGDSVEQLIDRVEAIFKCSEEHGTTLSNTKYQVDNEVKFAGYVMSDKGTRPDPYKVVAISQFPIPEDLTNLRSFLGLANQFSDFSPDLRHSMEPMKGTFVEEKCLCLECSPHSLNGGRKSDHHWSTVPCPLQS